MKKVSLKDIARMAGVAPSTVSFVLNGKAREMRISDILENRILKVAEKAGYRPNQVAVNLRTGKSQILGLIVENISNNFFATLAKIIEDEAETFGYKVLYCSTENNSVKGRDLIHMLEQHQVGGYLITPSEGMESDIRKLMENNQALVLMDRYFPDLDAPYVAVDNFGAVTTALDHLIAKGYKRIGFVTIALDLVQMNLREEAFVRSMKMNGNEVPEKHILKIPYDFKRTDAIGMIQKFITQNKLEALLFSTNYLGILGLESIQQSNIRIPEEIAVISFDDHDIFRLYNPGITAIRQPIEQIAKTAIHLLMEQLGKHKNGSKKNQVQLAAEMIFRGST